MLIRGLRKTEMQIRTPLLRAWYSIPNAPSPAHLKRKKNGGGGIRTPVSLSIVEASTCIASALVCSRSGSQKQDPVRPMHRYWLGSIPPCATKEGTASRYVYTFLAPRQSRTRERPQEAMATVYAAILYALLLFAFTLFARGLTRPPDNLGTLPFNSG